MTRLENTAQNRRATQAGRAGKAEWKGMVMTLTPRTCHRFESVFSGHAIPAAPGLELVSVGIDEKGEGDGAGYWVYREAVHAWGSYKTVMFDTRSLKTVSACLSCKANGTCDEYSLRPMLWGFDSAEIVELVSGEEYAEGYNTAVVGLFVVGQAPTPEQLSDAVSRARRKIESAEKRHVATQVEHDLEISK